MGYGRSVQVLLYYSSSQFLSLLSIYYNCTALPPLPLTPSCDLCLPSLPSPILPSSPHSLPVPPLFPFSPIPLFPGILAELYTLRPLFPGSSEADEIYKICSILGKYVRYSCAVYSSHDVG